MNTCGPVKQISPVSPVGQFIARRAVGFIGRRIESGVIGIGTADAVDQIVDVVSSIRCR